MKSQQTYRVRLRKGPLYRSLDALLYEELSKLEKGIQNYLDTTNLGLKVYWDKSHPYNRECTTNWELAIDFEDYQWSYKIGKPHWLYLNVLKLKEKKEDCTLILENKKEIRSSFNFNYDGSDPIQTHLDLDQLEDETVRQEQLLQLTERLKTIYTEFIKEIDIIELDELEKYEEDEILEMDQDMHNEEKRAVYVLLEAERQASQFKNADFYRIARYYDDVVKDYQKAIHYYSEYLKSTSDERSKQRIKALEKFTN